MSPFTTTGHCPPFWPPAFCENFENVILHFSMSTQKGSVQGGNPNKINISLLGMI